MRKGRDRATLGQIFWGHSSGNPSFFAPILPIFFGPPCIFLMPLLEGSTNAALLLCDVDRVRGTHLPTFAGSVYSILKGFPRI